MHRQRHSHACGGGGVCRQEQQRNNLFIQTKVFSILATRFKPSLLPLPKPGCPVQLHPYTALAMSLSTDTQQLLTARGIFTNLEQGATCIASIQLMRGCDSRKKLALQL